MWNCVEEQVENGTKYGRIVRKIIFGDIFADRTSVLKQKPIAKVEQKLLKRGDTIAYLEQDEIREARFLCSNSEQNDAKYVVTELLTSEDDIKEWYTCNTVRNQQNLITRDKTKSFWQPLVCTSKSTFVNFMDSRQRAFLEWLSKSSSI